MPTVKHTSFLLISISSLQSTDTTSYSDQCKQSSRAAAAERSVPSPSESATLAPIVLQRMADSMYNSLVHHSFSFPALREGSNTNYLHAMLWTSEQNIP